MNQSNTGTTFYTLNENGQLVGEEDPLGRVTEWEYDGRGRPTSVTGPDPDGAGGEAAPVTSFGYDPTNNITRSPIPWAR